MNQDSLRGLVAACAAVSSMQAAALIEDRDRRETLAKSRADGAQVLADLQRRAAETAGPRQMAAAGGKHPLN